MGDTYRGTMSNLMANLVAYELATNGFSLFLGNPTTIQSHTQRVSNGHRSQFKWPPSANVGIGGSPPRFELTNLLRKFRRARSRTKGCVWRTVSAPRGRLRCSPIRKHGFRNSGLASASPRDSNRVGASARRGRSRTNLAASIFIEFISGC